MEIKLERICERDIDLLLMRLFVSNSNVCELFYNKAGLTDYKIESVQHSAIDLYGESDIEVLMQKDGFRYLIMIEDKIDAPAQAEQYERYVKRGKKYIKENVIDDFLVFIVAPEDYLIRNTHARKYQKQISYEDILEKCKIEGDCFSVALLEKAIDKGLNPGQIDDLVSDFWRKYYTYQEQHASNLKLYKSSTQKGSNATWPNFKTELRGVKIVHKSEKGFVDLQFARKAVCITELADVLNQYRDKDMNWHIANKSAALRIEVCPIDFSEPFEKYLDEIPIVFDAVNRLEKITQKILNDGVKLP